jgi:aminopeptidase N
MRRKCSPSTWWLADRLTRLSLPALLALADPAAAQIQSPPPTYHRGIDVVDYDILVELPDSGAAIEGRAVLTVARTAAVDTLRLDLIDLRVDSVLVDNRPVRFVRDRARILIALPAAIGQRFMVAVRYGGEVRDGLIVRTDSAGRWTAFGDNWPNRGRYWIPSVDHPSDKATVTWSVLAPSHRRVVANGELLEETPLAGRRPPVARARTLTRWRESRPIPVYLMVLAAAPLAYFDLGRSACGLAEMSGCVRQSVYVAPELRDYLPGPFAQSGQIVEYFSTLVAPYPYEKLAHVQSSTRFGGMENATAIFYSDRAFRSRSVSIRLIAHETAHQWFGNSVTQREWAHLWLSEGFATYLAALWTQRSLGDSAFRTSMAETRTQIIESPVTLQRPVIDSAETDYLKLLNTNSYQKGGWVLHMLRAQVGDTSFFAALRSYYQKYKHGTALTQELQREVEREAKEPLGWFFDQWLRRPGFIDATLRWRFDERAKQVVLEVEQSTRFAPYRFPLKVEIRERDGRAHRATVPVPAQRTARLEIPIRLDRAPAAVIADPDVELLANITMR